MALRFVSSSCTKVWENVGLRSKHQDTLDSVPSWLIKTLTAEATVCPGAFNKGYTPISCFISLSLQSIETRTLTKRTFHTNFDGFKLIMPFNCCWKFQLVFAVVQDSMACGLSLSSSSYSKPQVFSTYSDVHSRILSLNLVTNVLFCPFEWHQ